MFFEYCDKVFSPYVQIDADNLFKFEDVYNRLRQKYFTFGFINKNNKENLWNYYEKEIEKIRDKGGDVIISFGGADGDEIAYKEENEEKIYNDYKSVIEKYKLKWIDLDIEGEVLKDEVSNKRRNNVLKRLKNEYKDLIISYTLPVSPKGLNNFSLKLLNHTKEIGLYIDIVNIMCMDYGDYYAPEPNNNMGYYAKLSAIKTRQNLDDLGLYYVDIGVTVMIGQNDVKSEIFNTYDATYLMRWCRKTDYIRLVSYWSINRDNGSNVNGPCSCNYSSIKQELYEFCKYFKSFIQYNNLALEGEVSCSSVEDDKDEFNAISAVDGDPETRWASQEYKECSEWIELDLLKEYYISEILISWEVAYAKRFKVYISDDGDDYKCIYNCKDNNKMYNRLQLVPVKCKNIKIECIEKATKYGFSIFEIELYNK